MRDPRYRFSDDVRTAARALALRANHSGSVATSAEALAVSIEQTEDLRERLVSGGYGSEFDAADLFPLYESQAAKARAASAARSGAGRTKRLWLAVILLVTIIVAILSAVTFF